MQAQLSASMSERYEPAEPKSQTASALSDARMAAYLYSCLPMPDYLVSSIHTEEECLYSKVAMLLWRARRPCASGFGQSLLMHEQPLQGCECDSP